jgi:glycosyltransferase involved in cell wall biosynthesis
VSTPRLRWLVLASHVPADGAGGGMVRYVLDLLSGLAEHPEVELHVLADAAARDLLADIVGDEARVHAMRSAPTPVTSLAERLGLADPVLRAPFDVVHGTKHLVPRTAHGRRVLTVHDMLPLDRPEDFGRAKRALLPGPYLASARDADVLVCVSAATRARLLSYVPSVRDRTVVVPLAPGRALFEAIPRPLPQLAGRRFALVVGDRSPRKNLAMVVDRWSQVAGDDDLRLAVVGPDGWGTDSVGSGVLDPRVELVGRVGDDELRWCYENAAVVLCPSLLEGFGLPAAEAAAFAAPLITSDDPALREAAGGWGTAVSSRQPERFAELTRAALLRGRRRAGTSPLPPRRSWADVADDTVQAVRHAG